MKKLIGKFLFDFVAKYIEHLDQKNYERLMDKVYRPHWTREKPLPMQSGKQIQFFMYESAEK